MAKIYASRQVRQVRELYEDHMKEINSKTRIEDWLNGHINILWEAYKSGDKKIIPEFSNFHPELIGASDEAIMAQQVTFREIENIVLEEYGFMTWDDVRSQGRFDLSFERAVNVALAGDVVRMTEIISAQPEIVSQQSQFGHQANLVQYLGANGVEIWRQYIAEDVLDMLDLLIVQGADPDAANNIYGGSNLRTLIETSEHTFQSGLGDAMLDKLAEYGY